MKDFSEHTMALRQKDSVSGFSGHMGTAKEFGLQTTQRDLKWNFQNFFLAIQSFFPCA